MAGKSKTTNNHNKIRKWAEARGGKPVTVRGTGDKDEPGLLRIDFPGYSGGDRFEEISWEEWFEKFDEKNLSFLYQDKTSDGKQSNFCKLVSRETGREKNRGS
jgi:hypothetical protein